MNKTSPLLSICIPTYHRPELLKQCLDSIFSQNIDCTLFEVCVSDDSEDDLTEKMILQYDKSNLKYQHIKPANSYLNILFALNMGKSKMLKLVNDYCIFEDSSLIEIINNIQKSNENELLFWLQKSHNNTTPIIVENPDTFIRKTGIMISYSICFGIWRKDLIKLMKNEETRIDNMFPHVSLLLSCMRGKNRFVIYEKQHLFNNKLSKKGGYNIAEVFGNDFLDLLFSFKDRLSISDITIKKIKKELLSFIAGWKAKCLIEKDVYYFSMNNDKELLKRYYNNTELILYQTVYFFYIIKISIKRALVNIIK